MIHSRSILAGPMLRRVENDLVSVFVALDQPAQVQIEVYSGQGPASSLGSKIAARAPAVASDSQTLAVGRGLHVVVAIWEPAQPPGLAFGEIYAYDLLITPDDHSAPMRLADLGLLKDNDANPGWLALGYEPGWLPGFAMVPAQVVDLKMVQGSCRGSNGRSRDALPPLDDLLRARMSDPALRPHLLCLTGDQVYADENAPELLETLQRLSPGLLGGDTPVVETIPVDFKAIPVLAGSAAPATPAETFTYPLDVAHFPPGRRTHLTTELAGFTSDHADSHTLGFGEFCALYLSTWCNVCWTEWDAGKLLKERQALFADYVNALRNGYSRLESSAFKGDEHDTLKKMIPFHAAWRALPARYRAIDAALGEADRFAAWGLNHPQDNADFALWGRFWVGNPEDPIVPGEAPANAPAAPGDAHATNRLARTMTPSWYAGCTIFGVDHDATRMDPDASTLPVAMQVTVRADKVLDRIRMLEWFRRDLPRVRRVLANVPTLMIFDDHEITDDWNITPGWAKRTRSSAFGRAIVRNGLAAVTLFQMWGNDPRAYRGGIPARVLALIGQMFAGATPDSPGPAAAATDELEALFDLLPRTTPPLPPGTPAPSPDAPPPPPPRMRWDFRYDGPGFEVLGLDSRTWRGFEPNANPQVLSPFSDDATATLLTDEALHLQVPETPALGVDPGGVCFVLTGAPVLGFPVVESTVQPLINLMDIASKSRKAGSPFVQWGQAALAGRVKHDPEPWGFVPALFEALLARLSSRRRVVFLSGDVHYAFTLRMSWWPLGRGGVPGTPTRFVQLTSSSLRQREAPTPIAVVDLIQQLGGAAAEQARWGWHRGGFGTAANDPPLVAGVNPFGPHLTLCLGEDPIVVSPGAVPDQTRIVRPAEWAWRTALVGDVRADDERLATLHPPPFSNANLTTTLQSVGERHFWSAQHAMPRAWHWWNNFSTITFVQDAQSRAILRHEVWGYDPMGVEPTLQPFLRADVPLDVGSDDVPPVPPSGWPL